MAEPFRYETRIRFVDTDASGRIHYTSLFKFFEAAETELFRTFRAYTPNAISRSPWCMTI